MAATKLLNRNTLPIRALRDASGPAFPPPRTDGKLTAISVMGRRSAEAMARRREVMNLFVRPASRQSVFAGHMGFAEVHSHRPRGDQARSSCLLGLSIAVRASGTIEFPLQLPHLHTAA